MKQIVVVFSLLLILGLTAGAVVYLSNRFAISFPIMSQKKWIWSIAVIFVFSFVGAIGLSDLSNVFQKAWSAFGSIMMGAFILLLLSVFITDVLHLIFKFAPLTRGYIALGLTLLFTIYGVWNAFNIKIKEITVPIVGLKEEIRAVHLTDIHLGNSRGEKQLKEIVKITKELKPDVIFHTGDLFDSKIHFNGNTDVLKPFETLNIPHYFVYGNHDEHVGVKQVTQLVEKSGATVLMNEIAYFKDLQIVGLNNMLADSNALDLHATNHTETVETILNELDIKENHPTLILHHRPAGVKFMDNKGAQLLLAGHTHAGQMFPFTLIAKWMFGYNKGHYKYNNLHIYVSEGVGTIFSPIRFGTGSEITLLRLIPVKN